MKKYLLTLVTVLSCLAATAQGARGVKIAYIDMEYILDKAPDYAEAKNQLEQKAQKWKQEIDVKKSEIEKLKEALKAEKALLTKELVEEREEEIAYLEKEMLDFQEKKFGPTGDLVTQKSVLVKPIQDQIFTIVQDLAEIRKYDFVFDKSSDLTMLFAANKHDISELVLTRMARAAKQESLSSRQLKKLEEQEKEEERATNPDIVERQRILDEKKAAKQKLIDDKRAAQQAKRDAYEAKKQQLKEEREAKKNGTTPPAAGTANKRNAASETETTDVKEGEAGTGEDKATTAEDKKSNAQATREAAIAAAKAEKERKAEEKRLAIEARKKELQERKEAAQRAKEEKKNKPAEEAKPAEATPTSPSEGNDPE
ncbi:OmpH family outer membrane protein [Flavobacterium sp. MFBS3-15]|uniref:OmpH family outer membrane protein n=1 Tax=Flavobacterium sp. MFBS3-15 TaxID=2989816 RepID=UPI002236AFEE|nr:OmpH family outer membrane protein [Flavobacterium sp. MFBS3-15]MCW4468239.1 OmpH family outer membrane protein [Flavobacterium sp. MFBS3-15]